MYWKRNLSLPHAYRSTDYESVLKRRFAEGDISEEEYDKLLEKLSKQG